MAKEEKALSYRVIIEPRSLGSFSCGSISDYAVEPDEERRLSDYRERCEQIVQDVKRHVDAVGSVVVEAETEVVCEYCGAAWTEDTDVHNGGCCGADCAVMDATDAKEKE